MSSTKTKLKMSKGERELWGIKPVPFRTKQRNVLLAQNQVTAPSFADDRVRAIEFLEQYTSQQSSSYRVGHAGVDGQGVEVGLGHSEQRETTCYFGHAREEVEVSSESLDTITEFQSQSKEQSVQLQQLPRFE